MWCHITTLPFFRALLSPVFNSVAMYQTNIQRLDGMSYLDPKRLQERCPFYHAVPKDFAANVRLRRKLEQEANRDPGLARAIWKKCAADPLYYINLWCWTLNTKDHASSPIRPHITHEQQDELILTLVEAFGKEDVCVTKSRDVGGTATCLAAIEWAWHFLPYQSFLVTSRKEELVEKTGDTRTLFYRFDFLHKQQPKWLLPTGRDLGASDPNRIKRHLLNIDNGSVIDGEATGSDMAVGDKRTAILMDERALMADNAQISLGTREATRCRISNSTPRGVANDGAEFYEIHKNPHIKTIVLHWSQHPEKNPGIYTSVDGELVKLDKAYEYPDDYEFVCDGDDIQGLGYRYFYHRADGRRVQVKVRSPWYDAEVKRASSEQEIAQELDINFLQSGWPFFDARMVEDHKQKYGRDPVAQGEMLEGVFKEFKRGGMKLWFTPRQSGILSIGGQFAIGCDIATGIGGEMSSNSAASVINTENGKKVAEFASQNIRPERFAQYVVEMCRWFNDAFLIWEANGPTGAAFGKKVLQLHYPYVFYRNSDELSARKRKSRSKKVGFITTNETKPAVLSQYMEALREGEFQNPSIPALNECHEYVHQPGGRVEHSRERIARDIASQGENHGDRVIADALAWRAAKDRVFIKEQPKKWESLPSYKLPRGCMARRMAERKEEARAGAKHSWSWS